MDTTLKPLTDYALAQTANKPFVVVLERNGLPDDPYFRPTATLILTSLLRTSGLLQALQAEDVKSLLFVLSFLHPNGHCQASVPELAAAMRISEMKTRQRMQRLIDFRFQGDPIVVEIKRESGLDAYAPTPIIFTAVERMEPPVSPPGLPVAVADKEQVISHSRTSYAHPRAEVEREIAIQNGWEVPDEFATPDEKAQQDTKRQLSALGLSTAIIDDLIARFDTKRIRQQLEWLPLRRAKNPSAYLIAAIEGNYAPPFAIRLHRARRQIEVAEGDPENTEPPPAEAVHEPGVENGGE